MLQISCVCNVTATSNMFIAKIKLENGESAEDAISKVTKFLRRKDLLIIPPNIQIMYWALDGIYEAKNVYNNPKLNAVCYKDAVEFIKAFAYDVYNCYKNILTYTDMIDRIRSGQQIKKTRRIAGKLVREFYTIEELETSIVECREQHMKNMDEVHDFLTLFNCSERVIEFQQYFEQYYHNMYNKSLGEQNATTTKS